MFSLPGRRKVRPSKASVAWAIIVLAAALLLAPELFAGLSYLPVAAMVCVAAPLAAFRLRSLRQGLPEPWGKGRASVLDSRSTYRSGLLMLVGGGVLIVLLFGSVFFIPPIDFFIILFGISGGLPLSVVLYYAGVRTVEMKSKSTIFIVVEEEPMEDGQTKATKTLEMSQHRES